MDDDLLEKHFAKVFCDKCGEDYTFKWHAATVAFQYAGKLTDMEGNVFDTEQIKAALEGKAQIQYQFEAISHRFPY